MIKHINEAHFAMRLGQIAREFVRPEFVTGPGRSGAIAAAYYSHLKGVPFIPWGQFPEMPVTVFGENFLIIDTSSMSGATLRKAVSKYQAKGYNAFGVAVFDNPGIHNKFWYEADFEAGKAHDEFREWIGAS